MHGPVEDAGDVDHRVLGIEFGGGHHGAHDEHTVEGDLGGDGVGLGGLAKDSFASFGPFDTIS